MRPLEGLTSGGKVPPFPGDSKMGKHPFKRPKVKTRAELESALDAHDRIQAISDEIRSRSGLPPLPENGIVTGWRLALEKAPAARKVKAKAPAVRQAELTPAAQVAAIRRRREAHEAEGEALRSEALGLFRSGVAGATAVGTALGVKRQRVYQLAEAV